MDILWKWVWETAEEDYDCYQWYQDWRRSFVLRETDPEGAIALLNTAIDQATRAENSWWRLFLEHWKLQVLLNHSVILVRRSTARCEPRSKCGRVTPMLSHSEFAYTKT
jgi:hypothetical protein